MENPDDNYMQHNPNVNKIYIYKAVCLENLLNITIIDSFDSPKIIKVKKQLNLVML